jgi:hypothetical protein
VLLAWITWLLLVLVVQGLDGAEVEAQEDLGQELLIP